VARALAEAGGRLPGRAAVLLRGGGCAGEAGARAAARAAARAGAAVARVQCPRGGGRAAGGRLLGALAAEWRRAGWLAPEGGAPAARRGPQLRPEDFLALLRGAGGGRPAVAVVEGAERLAADGAGGALALLLGLPDLLPDPCRLGESAGALPEVLVVLVSAVGWDGFRGRNGPGASTAEPLEVLLPQATPGELRRLLLAEEPPEGARWARAWPGFVESLVPSLAHTSSSVHDARALAEELFPMYCRPLEAAGDRLPTPRALLSACLPEWKATVQAFNREGVFGILKLRRERASAAAAAAAAPATDGGAPAGPVAPAGTFSGAPYFTKVLMLAAYVASANPTTADRRVFGRGDRKRRRADPQAQGRQADAAAEAKLQGPGSFTLDRLLAIFSCLVRGEWGGAGEDWRVIEKGAHAQETYSQVRNLVSLRLLEQSGGDLLEGARYRCNLDEQVAREIAKGINIHLSTYLTYV